MYVYHCNKVCIILGPPSNILFFQLVLILWMVTLPSSLVVYTPEQRFAKWACVWFTEDTDFGKKKIIFSDQVYFDLGGHVNKQNCCIWGTENSHAYTKR